MNANQAEKVRELLSQTTLTWIGLAVALIALAFLVHWIRAWYRGGADPADADDEIVEQMRELNLRGDLSDEEFRSIKSQLQGRRER